MDAFPLQPHLPLRNNFFSIKLRANIIGSGVLFVFERDDVSSDDIERIDFSGIRNSFELVNFSTRFVPFRTNYQHRPPKLPLLDRSITFESFSRPLFERIAGDETAYNSILSNPLTLPAPRSAPIVATDVLSQHGRASIISKLARLFFPSFAHIFANIFNNELRIMS